MIEEQHQAVVTSADANKDSNRAAKVGFVSLGWPRELIYLQCFHCRQ
jgi:hypothetical protein